MLKLYYVILLVFIIMNKKAPYCKKYNILQYNWEVYHGENTFEKNYKG